MSTPARMMIEVLGDKPVSRRLDRVKQRVENWEDVWPDVARALAASAKKQFDSHGVYGSGGWTPLQAATLGRKRARGYPADILRATGALERSLTQEADGAHLQIETPDSMWWGTLVPYAKYHQHGTHRLPVRKPIEPPEGARRDLVRALQQYALGNVSRMVGR